MKLLLIKESLESGKAFCALKHSQIQTEVIFVKANDERFFSGITNTLPLLEVDDSNSLFSSNAIVKFFLNDDSMSQATVYDQISEYEMTSIRPLVSQVVASGLGPEKCGEECKRQLSAVLKQAQELLPDEEASAGCIVLWFALYPLLCATSPFRPYASEKHKDLVVWFDKLQGNGKFSQAVSQVLPQLAWSSLCKQLSLVNLQSTLPKTLPTGHPPPPPLACPPSHALLPPHPASPTSKLGPSNARSPTESGPMKQQQSATSSGGSRLTPEEHLQKARQAFVCPAETLKKKPAVVPVLPDDNDRNVLICSALPYVNNMPHLGNIIGCVLSADVFSRYCRARGYNTLYICGTDEYGTATETKAIQEQLTPMQICDKYNKFHTEIYEWFNIGFDKFGRTTNHHQCKIAQDIFWDLYNNEYILKNSVEQHFCVSCDRFLADRFVEGECPLCAYVDARGDQCDKCGKLINAADLKKPRCKLCAAQPCIRQSQHLFLDLPKLEPLLLKHLDSAMETGVWSTNARTITKSWIRDGLKARCVSRDLKWGTPVPLDGYTDKVFYVWYDAPIGYISITADYTDQWKQWWQNPDHVELYHFMAKDNVPFHSVIFPSTLLGTNDRWTLLSHLCSTEYLNYEDSKFSKSRGVGVFGDSACETGIPADVFRFYLLFLRPETQDSVFSWDDLKLKNNSELLNNLGNFVNRALTFIKNNFDGVVQEVSLQKEDAELLANVSHELNNYLTLMEQARLRDGLRTILSISSLGNQYMQACKPWVLLKGTPEERARAGSVTSLAANIVHLISTLLHPFMPSTSLQLFAQLNTPHALDYKLTNQVFMHLKAGHVIGEVKPPFQKIESDLTDALKKKFSGKQEKEHVSGGVPLTEAELLAMIEKQGTKVRELKAAKAEKDVLSKEVEELLKLKAALQRLIGVVPGPPKAANKKKAKK